MGNTQSVVLSGNWALAANSGLIAVVAFVVSAVWLIMHRRRAEQLLPFPDFAKHHQTDFFQMFSRVTVVQVSGTIIAAYAFGSEGMMNAVFNKMPNAYILYIFTYMAYDAVWKIVGQFRGEAH